MKNYILVSVGTLIILILSFVFVNKSEALAIDLQCTDIDIVFARGSGQKLQDGENERLRQQLQNRIQAGVTMNYYELGTETYGDAKYGAITIGEWWKNGNVVGASLSAGLANDYGDSVNSGITELKSYLKQRHTKCPDTRIVLGGYSQGAQVIGQSLSDLSTDIQSHVDFVALFGDPKLYLPEGEGVYPEACYGKNLSAWRRAIANCHVDNGSLGARKPFLPESMQGKTGLWCQAIDFVCGTSKLPYDTRGHGEYKSVGGAIDQAAIEIAERLKLVLPGPKAVGVDIEKHVSGIGTTGMDVVFLLNQTGWTPERFAQTKEFIQQLADKIKLRNGRIAIAGYDGGHNWTFHNFTIKLSDSYADFDYVLGRYEMYESTTDVKPTLRSIRNTLEHFEWQQGAMKSLVVLTDSEFYNPDSNGQLTVDMIARQALEIDPVNIYPVVPASLQSSFQPISDATSGHTIVSNGDINTMVDTAYQKIVQRPTALLKNVEYSAPSGQEITFDASNSYAVNGTIVKYEWDFDGDGIFEAVTSQPTINHAYNGQYRGIMQLRITSSSGTVTNASAKVKIELNYEDYVPAAPGDLTVTTQSTTGNVSTIKLDWTNEDENIQSWIVSANGIPLGNISSAQTTINIADVQRDADVELSVTGMLSDGSLGDAATTTVEEKIATPPTPESAHAKPVSHWRAFLFELFRWLTPRWTHIPWWSM
ncbi:MAG TPA: cutinase family protein [Candidatus Saccharimonadales bacterium]|nr:cutinase family protein [Candidatus Saccharimonadales bacterium]